MKYCKKQNFIIKTEGRNEKAPDFEVGGFNSEGLVACEHVNQLRWEVHPSHEVAAVMDGNIRDDRHHDRHADGDHEVVEVFGDVRLDRRDPFADE